MSACKLDQCDSVRMRERLWTTSHIFKSDFNTPCSKSSIYNPTKFQSNHIYCITITVIITKCYSYVEVGTKFHLRNKENFLTIETQFLTKFIAVIRTCSRGNILYKRIQSL